MSRRKEPVDLQDTDTHGKLIEWLLAEHIKFKEILLPRVYEYTEH
jgi:hypothetical protein